jgi:predicted MFS family arabinose efflux permease
MELGRIAQAMLPVALVLLAITSYASPTLAGAFTFLVIFPGLIAAPFVGALIDRLGKVAAIRIDYVVDTALIAVIALLPLGSAEIAPILLGLCTVLGVAQLFSDAGFRSLFADLVPTHLLERVNAVDSSGYQIALIAGPPIAATLFAVAGASVTFAAIAAVYGLSALFTYGVGEAKRSHDQHAPILRSALDGLGYVLRSTVLRGMAISVSITGVALGIVTIVVPVLIVEELGADEALVGIAFAVAGVAGVAAAVIFGRVDLRGRERLMIVAAHLVTTVAALLLLPVASAGLVVGIAWVLASMALRGAGEGIWDLGVFTLRQRRTDPRMMGRAFAISMAVNYSGVPIGAALGGWLAAQDVGLAIWVAIGFGVAGTVLAQMLLPNQETAPADRLSTQEP